MYGLCFNSRAYLHKGFSSPNMDIASSTLMPDFLRHKCNHKLRLTSPNRIEKESHLTPWTGIPMR